MNIVLLYLLLVKATMTSFAGLASLPVLRGDLVLRYHLLSDHQLNTAVAAGRMGPGPLGNYVVSVGYQVAGLPGACAGWLAMITPAFSVIALIRFAGSRAGHPRAQAAVRSVILAGAGLLLSAAVPLARDAVTGPLLFVVTAGSFAVAFFTRVDTAWVILGAALLGLTGLFF